MGNSRGQQGIALVMVLLMLLIFLAVGAFVMLAVDRNTEMRAAYQRSVAGFHAAEAAVNQAAGAVRNIFLSFNVPTDQDCQEKVLWINEREVRYRLSVPGRQPGDCRPPDPLPQVTLPAGNPFEGLNAIVYTYNLRAEARHRGETEAIVNMQFEAYLIPMFQFAAFYGGDLELTVGPAMVVNGRLHSNGDMYLNTGNCNPGLRILGHLTIRGDLYRGRKDANANYGRIWISLDGSATNLRVFGRANPDDADCGPSAARRSVEPAEVALYQGRINEDAEAIRLPDPGLNCAPWSCPSGTDQDDMVYWNNADIRIVLDARPGQEKQLQPGVGPYLWPVVVVDRNGNVDMAKTEAIRRLMVERPGVITYTDVPVSRWNCRASGQCEDTLNARVAAASVNPDDDTLTLSPSDYGALSEGDAVRVVRSGWRELEQGATYYVKEKRSDNQIVLSHTRGAGAAAVDIGSGSGDVQLRFSRSYLDPLNYSRGYTRDMDGTAPGVNIPFPENRWRLEQYGCAANSPRGPRDPINGIPTGEAGSNYCNDYRYGGFFNHRERKPLLILNIDWMALEEWNQQNAKALWDPDDTSQGGLVVFLSVRGPDSDKVNNYAVRIYDAQRLTLRETNSGVTFASDVAMYVAGNFNCADPDESVRESTEPMRCGPGNASDRTVGKRPSSLVGDTVNVLSCAWVSQDWEGENPETATADDPWNNTGPCRNRFRWGGYERMSNWGHADCPTQGEAGGRLCPYRLRDERSTTRRGATPDSTGAVTDSGHISKRTVVNAAFLAGSDPTWCPGNAGGVDCNTEAAGDWYGGGLENYPRFHECWDACNRDSPDTAYNGRFWYEGSLVALAPPRHTCFSNIKNGVANDPQFPCSTSSTPYPGFWKAQRYSPPQRRWFYDVSFNDARNLPPLSPRFLFLVQNFFTEESR